MTAPYASYDFTLGIAGLAQQTSTPVSYVPQRLMNNLHVVSRRVDKVFQSNRPVFAPYIETRKFSLDGHSINSWNGTFNFPGFLLALNGSVSINGTTISSIETYPDSTMPPFSSLRLTDDCANWYTQVCNCCTPLQVSIPGIWGIHSDYAHAYLTTTLLNGAIGDTTTRTFTVDAITGVDNNGNSPLISVGHLVRMGTELVEVIATDATLKTFTGNRGAHGSTAATHLDNTPVEVWQVEEAIMWAVARQGDLMYSRYGAYTTSETTDFGEIRYPADFLAEVYGVLNHYSYLG